MKNPYENLISENFKEYERGLYDRYPTFLIPENQIKSGYDRLVENIKEEDLSGKRVFVIDGYNGANWDQFKSSISKIIKNTNISITWYDFRYCLKPEEKILDQINPFLGDDDPL